MTKRVADGVSVAALVAAADAVARVLAEHNVTLGMVNLDAGNEPDQHLGVTDDRDWTPVVTMLDGDSLAVTATPALDVIDVE